MAKPHRVCSPRKDKRTGKTYWTTIGSAWVRDTGSISVVLDALPLVTLNRDGDGTVCEFIIFPPDADDKRGGRQTQARSEPEDDIQY